MVYFNKVLEFFRKMVYNKFVIKNNIVKENGNEILKK